jgi:hypothetical protein
LKTGIQFYCFLFLVGFNVGKKDFRKVTCKLQKFETSRLFDFENSLSCSTMYLFTSHMTPQGAAVSLVELGEYEKASGLLEKLVKVCYLVHLVFIWRSCQSCELIIW